MSGNQNAKAIGRRLPKNQADALDRLVRGAAHIANQEAYLALLKKGFIAKRETSPWLCNITAAGRDALRAYREAAE